MFYTSFIKCQKHTQNSINDVINVIYDILNVINDVINVIYEVKDENAVLGICDND
jgi:hypothetical protein